MNTTEFNRALSITKMNPHGAAVSAARLNLINGLSASAAAREIGVDRSAVSIAAKRIREAASATSCPLCKRKF